MTFGEKLFELRKKNGFSQEELSEKIGVLPRHLQKMHGSLFHFVYCF